MTKIKKYILIIIIIGLAILLSLTIIKIIKEKNNSVEDNGIFNIVTTFYPMELIVRNIAYGAKDVDINNITKDVGGCVHEYSLTPNDAQIIEKADVFIINGGDMEHFINNINLKKINVIDSSSNILDKQTSSHFWMNIDLYILQVRTISEGLIKYNPENKDVYERNTKEYINKLTELKEIYDHIPKSNVNVAIMHDAFNYYKDKFNITASLISSHEGNQSASELQDFIDKINNSNTEFLLLDNETYNENEKLVETILKDTNVEIVILDTIVETTDDLNNYLDLMEYNYEIIKGMIGYGEAY